MGNIGENMTNGTVPPVGTTGTAYATTVNAFLEEVKERLEASVPLSSLQPGELDQLNNPITNVQYLGLYDQTIVPTAPIGSMQSYGGDLYWVSASGAAKITTGANLNAAGIGGITGDYGGVNPAQLRFVDVDETYYAYDNYGLGNWARFAARSFDIYGSVAGANKVRVTWAGSTSYTITLPAAPPGSGTGIVQMASTGTMTASSTVTEITVTGTSTLNDTVTLAANKTIVLSGTGVVRHGDYSEAFLCALSYVPESGASITVFGGTAPYVSVSAGATVHFHVPVQSGRRIKKILVSGTGSGGSTTPTATLTRLSAAGASSAGFSYSSALSGAITAAFEYTYTVIGSELMTQGTVMAVDMLSAGAATSFRTITVVYDQP